MLPLDAAQVASQRADATRHWQRSLHLRRQSAVDRWHARRDSSTRAIGELSAASCARFASTVDELRLTCGRSLDCIWQRRRSAARRLARLRGCRRMLARAVCAARCSSVWRTLDCQAISAHRAAFAWLRDCTVRHRRCARSYSSGVLEHGCSAAVHTPAPHAASDGLTLRWSGPPPAWHLAREALRLIIRLAGQAPSRRSARSAQTLGRHNEHESACSQRRHSRLLSASRPFARSESQWRLTSALCGKSQSAAGCGHRQSSSLGSCRVSLRGHSQPSRGLTSQSWLVISDGQLQAACKTQVPSCAGAPTLRTTRLPS